MNAISGGADHLEVSEQYLLQGLKAKDKQAVTELFELFNQPIYYFAFRLTQNTQEAEDIVNQCFLDLWDKDADFSSLQKIKSCLFVFARNRSFNYRKSVAVRRDHEDNVVNLFDTLETNVLSKIIDIEVLAELDRAVKALSPKKRAIITATIMEGKTAVQVAKEMGLTVSDIRETKRRTLDELRRSNPLFSPSLLPFLLTISKLHA